MRCFNCNATVEDGSVFCPECGEKLKKEKVGGKSYHISPENDIWLSDEQVKINKICQRLEEKAQRDTVCINNEVVRIQQTTRRQRIDANSKGIPEIGVVDEKKVYIEDDRYFYQEMCKDIIPRIGTSVDEQISLSVKILKEHGIDNIDKQQLWGKIITEFRSVFDAADQYLNYYSVFFRETIKSDNPFFLTRKLRLYRVQSKALRSENYILFFNAYHDIHECIHALIYGKGSHEEKVRKQLFANLGINDDELNNLDTVSQNSLVSFYKSEYGKSGITKLSKAACKMVENYFQDKAIKKLYDSDLSKLVESCLIINKVKEKLITFLINTILSDGVMEQIGVHSKEAEKRFNSLHSDSSFSDKIDAFCRSIELDPRNTDYYLATCLINPSSRKELQKITDDVGLTPIFRFLVHKSLQKQNNADLMDLTKNYYVIRGYNPVAYDQDDLEFLLEYGLFSKDIYLFNNSFIIPLQHKDLNYHGIGKVYVDIDVDFNSVTNYDEIELSLDNVQLTQNLRTIFTRKKKIEEEFRNSLSTEELYRRARDCVSSSEYVEALKYYEVSAKRDHVESLYELGVLTLKDYPVTNEKRNKALGCFKKAALLGDKTSALEYLILCNNNCALKAYEQQIPVAFEVFKVACKNMPDKWYCKPNIPEKLLKKAISSYGKRNNIEADEVIALHDSTYFENGENGIIFTGKYLLYAPSDYKGNDQLILLSDIKQFKQWGGDEIHVILNNEKRLELDRFHFYFEGYWEKKDIVTEKVVEILNQCLFKCDQENWMSIEGIEFNKKIKDALVSELEKEVSEFYSSEGFNIKSITNKNTLNKKPDVKKEKDYRQGIAKDTSKAVSPDQENNPSSQRSSDGEKEFNLGEKYYHGTGVEKNYETAAEWYQKAAETGHVKAMVALGNLYSQGLGVIKNNEETIKWYQKAADVGYSEAMKLLMICYHEGKVVKRDETSIFKWMKKYVETEMEKGNMDSQVLDCMWALGNCYFYGTYGVTPNDEEAIKWYQKAADAGYLKAMDTLGEVLTCLGVRYYNGKEVKQDYVKSFKWFQKAAEARDKKGMEYLADAYRDGIGVKKDLKMARYWYKEASDLGNTDAKKSLIALREEIKGKKKKDNGGCFITTAVCSSLNKPDDCDELMTMRWYRDKLKSEDPDMAALISEYYRTAPLVVKKINNDSNPSLVYRQLWEESISKIYHSLKKEEYRDATLRYVDMFEGLCRKYDTPIAYDIQDRIKAIRQRS